jgi:hypothetical protein
MPFVSEPALLTIASPPIVGVSLRGLPLTSVAPASTTVAITNPSPAILTAARRFGRVRWRRRYDTVVRFGGG